MRKIDWKANFENHVKSGLSVSEYCRQHHLIASQWYARMSSHPIPKCSVTVESLAYIVTSKYVDGLSLHRLEKIYNRAKDDLGRDKMSRWMIQLSENHTLLKDILHKDLLASDLIAMGIKVLGEVARAGLVQFSGKAWRYLCQDLHIIFEQIGKDTFFKNFYLESLAFSKNQAQADFTSLARAIQEFRYVDQTIAASRIKIRAQRTFNGIYR